MKHWFTKSRQGDDIELEEIEMFHIPKPRRNKFGNNTAVPTPHQKKMWKRLTIPGTKASEEWMERSKQSMANILANHGGKK